jgi:hypothetical protein
MVLVSESGRRPGAHADVVRDDALLDLHLASAGLAGWRSQSQAP